MSGLHNKIISYSDLKQVLPDRLNCLDPQERVKVEKTIRDKKPLLFLPTYLMETHMQDVKYEKAKYKIVLMGILKDGRKVNVVLDDIEPYFEVRIKDGTKEEQKSQIQDITDILCSNELTEPVKKSLIKAKPFKYYQQHKSWFLRLYYNKTKNRQLAIDAVRKQGYETTTDDKNSYYRVVCRDFKTTFSSWALLENYTIEDLINLKGDSIRVSIKNYKSLEIDLFAKAKMDFDEITKEKDTKKKEKKLKDLKQKQLDEARRIRMLDKHPEYKNLFSDEYNSLYKNKTFTEMTSDEKTYKILDEECESIYQTLLKDKTLSCCWDIETWSKNGDLPQPENKDDNIFCLSMTFQWVNEKDPFLKICLCDYPANAKPGYLTIICGTEQNIIKAFSDIFARMRPEFIFGFNDSDYDWNWVIKRSAQKKGMLSYISKNFDSTIPYKTYSEDEILRFSFKKERVKVEAETFVDGYSLMMSGYIPVDVRTIFRRLYPTAEQSSLKWFLAKNKLGGKEDMPYEKLFAIYRQYREFMELHKGELLDENGKIKKELDTTGWSDEEIKKYEELKEQLGDINNYCVIDAQRCHDLVKIRCVVMDHREVSNLSYVSVYDAFYRANGMKVRNLTIAIGQQEPFNIRFSNITDGEKSDDQYPGAYVFPPKKGLKISKLSMEERIKKANITKDTPNKACQEWLNTTPEELTKYYDIIEKHGAVIVDDSQISVIEEEMGGKIPKKFKDFLKESIGRPITGLDFSSLYPSLIRAYNFSPDYCILSTKEGKQKAKELHEAGKKLTRVCFDFGKEPSGKSTKRLAYFVWHNNKYDPYLREENGDIKLDNNGKPMCDPEFQFGIYPYILNDLFDKRSLLKAQMKDQEKIKEEIEAMTDEDQKKNSSLYDETVFQVNYLKSKQNALKVFMNTFYGEAGNQISPFFVLEVAGGITTYGQKNIMKAQAYVEEQGCDVHYGDTDSLYISMPEKTFCDADKEFYSGKSNKLDYWTKLVTQTFKAIDVIRDGVNNMFVQDNGTKFLSMAYEEVLYPVAFTAKKKYFGIAHEHIPNFKPKDLFIRGLEVKKRGVSDLLRKIFTELMWISCNSDNIYDLIELVRAKIDEIYSRQWKLSDFVQTGVYRSGKKNVKINTLVARMKQRGIDVKPNERFGYVIVKKYPYSYDLRGRKTTLSIGDKLELVEIAEKEGHAIDLDYYMQGSVNGQLARLITYHPMFHVEPFDSNDKDELHVAETKTYKNACKFVDDYCNRYYAKYNTFGKSLQKIYKTANKVIGGSIKQTDDLASELLSANVSYDDFESWFVEYAEKHADKTIGEYGKEFVMSELSKISNEVRKKYKNKKIDDEDEPDDTSDVEDEPDNTSDVDDEIDVASKKQLQMKKEINELRKDKLKDMQKSYYGGKKSIQEIRTQAYNETMSILRKRIRENYDSFMALYKVYNNGIQNIIDVIKDRLKVDEELKKPTTQACDFKLEDFDFEIDDFESDLSNIADTYTNNILKNDKLKTVLDKLKNLYADIKSARISFMRTENIVSYLKQRRDHENKMVVRPNQDVIRRLIEQDISNNSETINNLKL
jgi:DNA polymerase elongation subunit (family B)